VFFELCCKRYPEASLESLGHIECEVTEPSGKTLLCLHIQARHNPMGVVARMPHPMLGEYRIKWLATGGDHKLYEVTRGRFSVTKINP